MHHNHCDVLYMKTNSVERLCCTKTVMVIDRIRYDLSRHSLTAPPTFPGLNCSKNKNKNDWWLQLLHRVEDERRMWLNEFLCEFTCWICLSLTLIASKNTTQIETTAQFELIGCSCGWCFRPLAAAFAVIKRRRLELQWLACIIYHRVFQARVPINVRELVKVFTNHFQLYAFLFVCFFWEDIPAFISSLTSLQTRLNRLRTDEQSYTTYCWQTGCKLN